MSCSEKHKIQSSGKNITLTRHHQLYVWYSCLQVNQEVLATLIGQRCLRGPSLKISSSRPRLKQHRL